MILNWLKKQKRWIGIFTILPFAVYYISCNITNPQDNIDVIFNTLSIATNASVNFVDAATGAPIGSSSQRMPVNLTITGSNSDKIVTSLNEPQTSFSTNVGLITFGVIDSYTPTSSNPVNITLVASSNGYQTTSLPISITSTGSSAYTIRMIKTSAPPTGTSTATPTSVPANSSGTTTSTVNITTSTEPASKGNASIIINSGTTLKDANGNPVTGNLIANVTYTSGSKAANNSSMPTGLSVNVSQGATRSRGYLQPAAVASYTIANQNSQLVSKLSSPVTLSMTIPSNTVNIATGNQIRSGDIVPIYSFNETTQMWQFETNSNAVGPDANGNFIASFQATHLSYWLSGWIASGGQVCTTDITLNILGSYSVLLLKLKISDNTILTQNVSSNQNKFVFSNLTIPKGLPVTIEAYSLLECPAVLVGSTTVQDLCSTNTVNLNVDQGSNLVNVNVDVTAICPNKNPVLKIKPSGYDIFILNQCGTENLGTINNGQITLNGLKMGATYTFGMFYKGVLYTQEHTIDQTYYNYNYNISDSVCNSDFK